MGPLHSLKLEKVGGDTYSWKKSVGEIKDTHTTQQALFLNKRKHMVDMRYLQEKIHMKKQQIGKNYIRETFPWTSFFGIGDILGHLGYFSKQKISFG